MGGSHDGVFRIRPWFCRVNFKLDILHHHGEEYEDAALGQRFSQAYPLSDSKWGELESNGVIYILLMENGGFDSTFVPAHISPEIHQD